MAMKIALFTAAFSSYPIERAFEAAAKYGYDGIEIGGFRPHAYAPDLARGGAAKIRELSSRYNLPIVSDAPENTGSPYSLVFADKQMNQESLEYFKLTLDMAKEIGSEYCMFACNHPGFGRYKEDVKKLFIENMRVLAEHAEKIGQTIILEPVTPYEGTIITTSDDVRWALDEVNSPRFKCMLDLACPLTCGEPVSAYFEKMGDDIRKNLNGIADAQWFMTISGNSFAAKSMSSSYESLKDTFDDIRDGKLQEDNEAVIRQLENAQDQVAMAGESLYIALTEMELNGQGLSRSITALDRTIKELNLRYDLGQISALTLEQTKAGRTSALSGQETLTMNICTYKTQLEQMIGAELTGKIKLQGLPQVTGQQLAAMDLDKDLAAAKEASYTLFAAQRTLDDARDDFKDTAEANMYSTGKYQYVAAQHQWQAAQYTYNAAVQSFETSFRTLYLQVKDYQQVLQAAKTALAMEQDNFAAAQKKHDLGNLSDNALADAKDKVSEAQDKVDGAAIDLFSAYNNYRWAVDHGILN